MRVLRCKFYGRIEIKPRRDIKVHVNDAAKSIHDMQQGEPQLSSDLTQRQVNSTIIIDMK